MSGKWLRCSECRELQPPEEFPIKGSTISGRRGVCLTCRPPKAPKPRPESLFPRRVRVAMCGKKHRYRDRGQALVAAQRSARRTALMRVYECPLCKGWHLTHKPERSAS